MSALALGFTACDDYDEVPMPSNPQQPVLAIDGVEVAAGDQLTTVDLNTYAADSLELVKTVATPAMNEGTSVSYDVEIAASNDFAAKQTVRLHNGKIAKEDLDNAFRALINKTPNAKPLYFRFAPYFTDGTSYVRIGSTSSYLTPVTEGVSVTPINMNIEVESVYYVVDAMFGTGWVDNKIAMTPDSENVYDTGSFTVVCNITGPVQIMSQKDIDAALADPGNEFMYAWGAGETDTELVYGENAGVFSPANGQYRIKIDMFEKTVSVKFYAPTLYAVGNYDSSNWGFSTDRFIYERAEGTHYGFVDMTLAAGGALEFKFTTQPDWKGIGYGAGDAEGTLSSDPGAGNLKLAEGGIYYVTLSVDNMTYTTAKINSWGLVGDGTPGGWDADTELTYQGNLVWKATVTLTDGSYKFRANGAWDINLGGDIADLQTGGDNIAVEEAGTYDITLDLSDPRAWNATVVKK